MPEQLPTLLSLLEASLPELSRGELYTVVILAGVVIAAILFVLTKPR